MMEGCVHRGWGNETRAETKDKERMGETDRCWQAGTDRKCGRALAGAGGVDGTGCGYRTLY